MKNIIAFLLLGILICTGCETFSTEAYKSTKREMQGQIVLAAGDEAAIKAWKSGDAVGIGVDLFAVDVIMYRPFKQVGAAVLDAGAIYLAKEGLEYLVGEINFSASDSRDITINISDSQDTSVLITGDTDTTTKTESSDDNSGHGDNR